MYENCNDNVDAEFLKTKKHEDYSEKIQRKKNSSPKWKILLRM